MKMKAIFGFFAIWGLVYLAGCGPVDVKREMKEAYAAARKGDWKSAMKKADRCLDEVPGDVNASAMKSVCLLNMQSSEPDRLERALELARQATTAAPERYDLWLLRGTILMAMGHVSDARAPLQRAYELHMKPELAAGIGQEAQGTVKYMFGLCCMLNGSYEETLRYWKQAVKSTPFSNWPALYNDIAVISYNLGIAAGGKLQYLTDASVFANTAVKVISGNAKKSPELNPSELSFVYANVAVLCDVMSMPGLNNPRASDYEKVRGQWYAFARQEAIREAGTGNASRQTACLTLVSEIDRRLKALGPQNQ